MKKLGNISSMLRVNKIKNEILSIRESVRDVVASSSYVKENMALSMDAQIIRHVDLR
jgi:hypothetical protein